MHGCCVPASSKHTHNLTPRASSSAPASAAGLDLGLIELPGGPFTRGTEIGLGYASDGESPPHTVTVSAFAISRFTVSNAQFASFVEATGHRTVAEEAGASFVFGGLLPDDFPPTQGVADAPWWRLVEGASWHRPEGLCSDLEGREHHPVVHVDWHDAMAFCAWSGTRLPTETEWEFAARGGLQDALFPWGNELEPGGVPLMNVFQGTFPGDNTAEDGYLATCPVDAFPPNGYGLHNTTGNVWEWCSDWFDPTAYRHDRGLDPTGPLDGSERVMRGGSYLCHASYCHRYRNGARSSSTPDSSSGNVGFRVAQGL